MPRQEDFLPPVQAQVMTRDDPMGGWVPMGTGGLSNVGLQKVAFTSNGDCDTLPRNEYYIFGKKMDNNSVVLNCKLKKDIKYNRANPKFHHWQSDDKRFGLIFVRSDDAKAFDKGIRKAVADLADGSTNSGSEGDDEVFAVLDLPMSRQSSQSASTNSTTTSSPTAQSPSSLIIDMPQFPHFQAKQAHLHRVQYTPHPSLVPVGGQKPLSTGDGSKPDIIETSSFHKEDIWGKEDSLLGSQDVEYPKDNSYVVFAKSKNKPHAHEYSYPTLESVQKPPSKRESKIKRQQPLPSATTHPPLPIKDKSKNATEQLLPVSQKLRCKHCHDFFQYEHNPRGSCQDAPDGVEKCIEYVTCVWCAKGLLYHCMADPDGDYGRTCMCDQSDDRNCKKWTALAVLSLLFPCLWCYPPLMWCHNRGVQCGCCGGRHKAM